MSEILNVHESKIAAESYPTAANFNLVSKYIWFPPNVEGSTILDIGGGASTAVLELRRKGAQAYAVDYLYGNLPSFEQSIDDFIVDPSHQSRLIRQEQPLFSTLNQLNTMKPLGIDRKVWREKASRKTYYDMTRNTSEEFLSSVSTAGSPYVAALAGALPFSDDTFDMCYSLQCVSQFLVEDPEVFMTAVLEGIRVLKPGAVLQLHPWLRHPSEGNTPAWRESAYRLHRYLQENQIHHVLQQPPAAIQPLLVIQKN